MPTYAYACTACDHRFEVRQSFTDAAVSECPECSGDVRKLFNSVGIVFKGSGFYKTDSRASNGNGASGSGKESASKGSAAKDSSGSGSGDKAASTVSTGSSGGSSSGSSGNSGGKDSSSAA